MPLNVVVNASIEGEYRKTLDGGDVRYPIRHSEPIVLRNGTGIGKADIFFDDERTLASNTSENLDFAGALADAFGATIAAAKVKGIEIESDDANTTNLTVGAAASNAFVGPFADATDALVLRPGDRMVFACPAGWTVTAGTGDLLKVANAAGAVATYRVKVVASSA